MVIEWYPCCMHDTHLLNNIHCEKYCPLSSISAVHNINRELRVSKMNASYFFMVSGYATGKCSGQSKEFFLFLFGNWETCWRITVVCIDDFEYWTMLSEFWKSRVKLEKFIAFSLAFMYAFLPLFFHFSFSQICL